MATKKKTSTKASSKIDLNKVKDFVVENKDTIEKVVAVASELMSTKTSKKTSTKKSGTKTTAKKTTKKRTTSSKKDDNLSSMINLASSLLKK